MKISLLCVSLLFSSAAVANPMMVVQELSAQVVAGPHVKLTLTYNNGGSDVTKHGSTQSPWINAGSTSRDTGSGVKELPIIQMCDCHVPASTTLDYKVGDGGMSPLATTHVSVPTPDEADRYGDACKLPCEQADADAADAGRTNGSGGATTTKASGGGCAFVTPKTSPTLLGLALLGLGFVLAARRRRP
jgi:MYXO-CTERM domain-containing protein